MGCCGCLSMGSSIAICAWHSCTIRADLLNPSPPSPSTHAGGGPAACQRLPVVPGVHPHVRGLLALRARLRARPAPCVAHQLPRMAHSPHERAPPRLPPRPTHCRSCWRGLPAPPAAAPPRAPCRPTSGARRPRARLLQVRGWEEACAPTVCRPALSRASRGAWVRCLPP